MILRTFPEIGDIKTGVSFAWLPIITDSNKLIWLEKYKWKKTFCSLHWEFAKWHTQRWRMDE